MADNIALPATGSGIATDEIAGVHHQRVKIQAGASWYDEGDDGPEGSALDLAARLTGWGDNGLVVVDTPMINDRTVLVSGMTAQTYAAGDLIGGILAVSVGDQYNPPLIDTVTLVDGSGIGPQVDIFVASFYSLGTGADGAAWAPTIATDAFANVRFVRIPVASADWVAAGSMKVASPSPRVRVPGGANDTLSVAVVARSSYTMATNNDFRVSFTVNES